MSARPLASARLGKLIIRFLNHLLNGDLCKKLISIIYLLVLLTIDDFMIYIDFARIAASNTAINDVAN